jgi:hypothetical protein
MEQEAKPKKKRDGVPYNCIRCGYTTFFHTDMVRHFQRKKLCSTAVNNIELTDHIKNHILKYRVYHIPAPVKEPTMLQIINNNNTMNNFIAGIEPMAKLQSYLNYKNILPISFDQSVDQAYGSIRHKLENDQGHHFYNVDEMLEVVDSTTRMSDNSVELMNVLYDADMNKLVLYDSGHWREMFFGSGAKEVIKNIQDYFWNAYECYVIRKLESPDVSFADKNDMRVYLHDYYKLLASMNVEPYVQGKSNNKIMYSPDDDRYDREYNYYDMDAFTLSDKYNKEYNKISESLSMKQREKTRNEVYDLIKRNSKRNIAELNKLVMSLLNVNEEYKKIVLALK